MLIALDSWQMNIFMTILTIYALFFDDIRVILFEKKADDIFYGINSAALFFFTMEIVMSSIAKKDEYWLKFFFWLDVVSTASLIADIGWIFNFTMESNTLSLTKTSRAGRVTRIIRVVRLIRLFRIVKLYK
jgi:hypothetical protein